jgi:nucleoside 2-deoxyribosyltransferase
MSEKKECYFTGENAQRQVLSKFDGWYYQSEGCGDYWIDNHTMLMLSGDHELSTIAKLNCASETIKLNEMGLRPFWVYKQDKEVDTGSDIVVIREIKDMQELPVEHSKKSEGILAVLSEKLNKQTPFTQVHFTDSDMYKLKISNREEFLKWFAPLVHNGYVELGPEASTHFEHSDDRIRIAVADMIFKHDCVGLSAHGWRTIEESHIVSNHAFIAMAFTDNEGNQLKPELRMSIKDACDSLGWEAKIVDEIEHNDGIMDKVIALINNSSFVIAELTHQKSGVYYEAGYAKGRGLPVIHVVSKEDLRACHFDVKHLNLVVWENLDELKEKLKNRIEATIGVKN